MRDDERTAAELALVTLFRPDDDLFALLRPALTSGVGRFTHPPPLGVIADVAFLLTGPPAALDASRRRIANALTCQLRNWRRQTREKRGQLRESG